jgi:AcrR family transcriptional regulator
MTTTSDRQLTTQGAERKQQLLDAAARLFAEQGYAATRVVDIVDAAGVAKGLFYWYFENKEALFRELAADMRRRLRRQQAAAIDDRAPALVRLLQGAVASVRFMAENAPFFSLLEVEGHTVSDVLRQGTEQHIRDVTALIDAGQRDGTFTEWTSRSTTCPATSPGWWPACWRRTSTPPGRRWRRCAAARAHPPPPCDRRTPAGPNVPISVGHG